MPLFILWIYAISHEKMMIRKQRIEGVVQENKENYRVEIMEQLEIENTIEINSSS